MSNQIYEVIIDESARGSLLLVQALEKATETCERVSEGVYHVSGDYQKIVSVVEVNSGIVQLPEAA